MNYRIPSSAFTLPLFLVAGLLLWGCQGFSPTFKPQPREQTYAAEPEQVLQAVTLALEEMDFRVGRSFPRQGRLEGTTPVRRDTMAGETVQTRAVVEVRADQPEGSRVQVWFSRLVQAEDQALGVRTHEMYLRDTGDFERFFEGIEQYL